MEFYKLVNSRQSVRKFSDKPVDRKVILQCIEAARLAPSACNAQPWKFIIVDDNELKNKIAKKAYGPLRSFNKFVPTAPVLIVITIEKSPFIPHIGGKIKNKPYHYYDIGITADHFCLQAEELGLGTCMLGWFNEKKVQQILHIPENREIGLLIAVGYPVKNYHQRKKIRKSIAGIHTFNKY